MATQFDSSCLGKLLPLYYKRLFPTKLIFKWLSYNENKSYFQNREFSFVLEGDVYLRYKCFNDQLEIEKELQSCCPHKIDIGPVYNYKPTSRKIKTDFEAQERELVFDIDLTDYDAIRTCCTGGGACNKCWSFMVIAVKVLDRALREDFGFKHLLWVFSGRRGVHCWVCDEAARKLSPQARSAVVDYLTLVTGGENQQKKVNLGGFRQQHHTSIDAAIRVIEPLFPQLLAAQDWFADNDSGDRLTKLVDLVPDVAVRQAVRDVVEKGKENATTSERRWHLVEGTLKKLKADSRFSNGASFPRNCTHAADELLLQYSYPRLDANVSKGLNHLLKSPFCVHPKTGKVSVPFDPATVEEFDLEQVPRIDQLCEELFKLDQREQEQNQLAPVGEDAPMRKALDYKKTSLREAVAVFESFIARLGADSSK